MKKIILSTTLFFSSALSGAESYYHYISKNVVDIHSEPDEMAEVVNQAIYGTKISIVDTNGPWIQIMTPDEYLGWIKGEDIITRDTSYPASAHVAKIDTFWSDFCWVDDTTPHPPAITLPFDSTIEIVSDPSDFNNRWIRVRLLDDTIVFAQTTDLRIDPEPLSISAMVKLSQRFLGLPYRWGGNSGFGFDCSGFLQTLYRQVGIEIPRDSGDQYIVPFAKHITEEELQPGDVVFFDLRKRNPPKVNHLGLFIGNGSFIQATTTNKRGPHVVQVTKLHDPEYYDKIAGYRRYAY